ncbi:hypothetical protein AT959_06870 [Dechloromonas denitrificans]|uniref:Uncharacterized protein n=1 Tax=Dechloromonas denitrificans TaxID=281362 RepID=A0A133XKF3_9RHOO|nr:hypothetical protein AT959_06870 [Dechloromonas denitrificans]
MGACTDEKQVGIRMFGQDRMPGAYCLIKTFPRNQSPNTDNDAFSNKVPTLEKGMVDTSGREACGIYGVLDQMNPIGCQAQCQ